MKAFIPAVLFLTQKNSSAELQQSVQVCISQVNCPFSTKLLELMFLRKGAGQHNSPKQVCSWWWLEIQNQAVAVTRSRGS